MGRGRPSLTSSSKPEDHITPSDLLINLPVSLSALRDTMQQMRTLPCFSDQPSCLQAIEGVIQLCLPVLEHGGDTSGLPPPPVEALPILPPVPPPQMEPGLSVSAHVVGPTLQTLYDGAWSIVLDHLELKEVLRCRSLRKDLTKRVEENLTVLSLINLDTDWISKEALACLVKFRRVKTLHWYCGQGPPKDPPPNHASHKENVQPGNGQPIMAFSYLLSQLKIDDITLTEGPHTDEGALEILWEHVLPTCAPQLKRLALSYEGYGACQDDEDHPPINIKKFAVRLAHTKMYPNLKELHLEMSSMSIAEQRSLVRGLAHSGLLSKLEGLTLGGGSTVYGRAKEGPGRELVNALSKCGAPNLKLLWLQRLDVWDDLEGLSRVLSSSQCPVLKELYLDLTLDSDDAHNLAANLHKFPGCLKTLGILIMNIENRDEEGKFELVSPHAAVEALAQALLAHPRPELDCLDLSLNYEAQVEEGEEANTSQSLTPVPDAVPMLNALKAGAAPNIRHLQLPNCRLSGDVFFSVLDTIPTLPKLQTLDLSGNELGAREVQGLLSTLLECPYVYEVILEECCETDETKLLMQRLCADAQELHPRVQFFWKSREEVHRGEEGEEDDSDNDEHGGPPGHLDEGSDDDFMSGSEDGDDHGHHHHMHEMEEGDEPMDWDVNADGEHMVSDGEIPSELDELSDADSDMM